MSGSASIIPCVSSDGGPGDMTFTLFPYTRYLELEIKELKEERARLLELLAQAIATRAPTVPSAPPRTAADMLKDHVTHRVEPTATGARCICGEIFTGGDPGTLQTAISAHITEQTRAAVRGGRKSWPEIRRKAEDTA